MIQLNDHKQLVIVFKAISSDIETSAINNFKGVLIEMKILLLLIRKSRLLLNSETILFSH